MNPCRECGTDRMPRHPVGFLASAGPIFGPRQTKPAGDPLLGPQKGFEVISGRLPRRAMSGLARNTIVTVFALHPVQRAQDSLAPRRTRRMDVGSLLGLDMFAVLIGHASTRLKSIGPVTEPEEV